MKQRSLFLILCFVLISFGVSSVSAQACMDRRTFIPNSTYDSNLRRILSSLPSSVSSQDGFYYNGSIGQEPNRVYATGLCNPGSTSDDCYDCIKTASDGLIQSCPNQTDAFHWPSEITLCHVRYSDTFFSGTPVLDPQSLVTDDVNISSNLTEFRAIWERLILGMIDAASTAKNRYKAEAATLPNFQDIYALMQCTPDLSSLDCKNCLRRMTGDYQSCCDEKKGVVVMRPSCFFSWELHPFSKAFNKIAVASPVPVPQPAGDRDNTTHSEDSKGISHGFVLAITVPTVVAVLLVLVLGLVLFRKRKSFHKTALQSDIDFSTEHSSQYDFKTIEAATNKFSSSNKLGEGGFGEVYKGKFSNGTEVAVKRLSKNSGQGAREFRNEAVLVSKLQHRNLVRLLGFCLEGEEKILIYEFVPNKSLDYFLFDPANQGQLDWPWRYMIIGGIARGILYLHQDSQLTIIHRDLKASNILLDADMNPKIADFGLATIFGMEQTRGNTNRVAGTYGYMSPEYAMHGEFSMKSDTYSFGVLVLEIISGKKNSGVYQMDATSTAGNLVTYAWRLWRNGSPLELVDPSIGRKYKRNEATKCIHIALLCVQENPEDRPMLSTIIMMLTSNTITLPVPRLPEFFPRSKHELDPVSEELEWDQSTSKSFSHLVRKK